MAKPREFWVLIQGRTATAVNWGAYDPQSVYADVEIEPRVGDVIIKVREFEKVKVTKKMVGEFLEAEKKARS